MADLRHLSWTNMFRNRRCNFAGLLKIQEPLFCLVITDRITLKTICAYVDSGAINFSVCVVR